MSTPETLFDNDIDVRVPKFMLMDAQELADLYGLNYYTLQCSHDMVSICLQFEEKKAERTMDFINDINTIKSN